MSTPRRLLAVLSSLVVTVAVLGVSAADASPSRVSLHPVATRTVGTPFTLHGTLTMVGPRHNKTVLLQKRASGHWVTVGRRWHETNGRYAFNPRSFANPQTVVYRTVVQRFQRTLAISPRVTVVVKAAPTPPPPPPAGNELLPDLGVKRLNDCSPTEKSKSTDGSCFWIDTSTIPGHKLLRFPGTTFNIGSGPMEIHATRDAGSSTWSAVQNIYTDSGTTKDVPLPNAEFYFAGDEHQHWHIKDFDSYQLLDPAGTTVAVGEKHGFCLQDNVSYRNWLDDRAAHPGMPPSEHYLESTSCGFGQPDATSIVHGLSVGWGDTYPTTLRDQYIDITGVPDGTYLARVTADALGLLTEKTLANNAATSTIRISGDTVTWISDDSGL